ncbi:MAG TPA: long-chain fatty acid--CoA ligase [Solirubrobacteraceae bacterium]|jgi:long-chain acyl-CoA synthetase
MAATSATSAVTSAAPTLPSSEKAAVRPIAERITGATTLGRMVLSAQERDEDVAMRYPTPEGEQTITYAQLGERARELARGLIALGIQGGDVISILCSTRAEWTVCELGAICAGAVIAPIYHTNSPGECRHVLEHSEARLVFCEDAEQVAKIAEIEQDLPRLQHVIVIDGHAAGANPVDTLRRRAAEVPAEAVEERVQAVKPHDVATLVYTSGTTGPPKGCMLTHANFLAATAMYRGQLELDDVQPVIYMFLPLAHVLARLAQTVVLDVGGTLVYWSRDANKILAEVAASSPTHFVAVPRIYEKLHTGVISAVEGSGPHAKLLFAWALEVGRRARTAERAGRPLGRLGRARLRVAERLALSKVRSLFGERLQMTLVGAAPIDHELLEFFDACGVTVLEGYGMTESCAAATLNPPKAPRFGTVGKALPDSEVMVSEEGEILMRGPHVFAGYHRDPGATRATFADGWLYSGDLGRLSEDGYLTVTGRKKDLIITSSGKNISPANIENALRESRWISEAVVYGDRRPYLVGMITLDPDEAPKLAEQLGIAAEVSSLAQHERVREVLQADIDTANARFARIEQVKRFGILDHDLSQADGELTPTLKVKRAFVYERYADFFRDLYAD